MDELEKDGIDQPWCVEMEMVAGKEGHNGISHAKKFIPKELKNANI